MYRKNKNILKATITPCVLKWAREAVGYSCDCVIEKINRKSINEKDLLNWEAGDDYPPIAIAKILAKAYGIKFITLYLPDIPKKIKPLNDLRRTNPQYSSANLVFLMREIQGKQEWIKEYLISKGKQSLPFVKSIAISDDINKAVTLLSNLLISNDKLKLKAEDNRKIIINKIENLGVFISLGNSFNGHHLYVISPSEARGFAIADKIAPFIFINSKDSKNAQLFTLIHEFCHILLGETGISDTSSHNKNSVEVFCNKVTAEFLMPTNKFKTIWNNIKNKDIDEKIKILAEKFPVSMSSIIIKIFDLNFISKGSFNRIYKKYESNLPDFTSTNPATRKSKFSNPYLKSLRINGKNFISTVIEAYRSNEIMIKNACSLLGIKKIAKLDTYEKKWSKYL